MENYDFIIVGAVLAGCVLAHQLCDDARNRVLVLKSGPTDKLPYVKIPLGYGLLFQDDERNYRFKTVSEAGLMDRRLNCPRRRVMGGSGSINALIWCRGMPSDYDGWQTHGCGWSDEKTVFEALETRSTGMAITNPVALRNRFTLHFAAAMAELGYPADADFNGIEPEGAGFYRITTRNGRRWSSANAFLRPAVAARCVRLITSAPINRVILKDGRAVGVSYVRHGSESIAMARQAVVMAAGAIQTPQILQVSGIGDGGYLRRIGIPVRLHNPNVEQHLQDHLAVGYYFRTRKPTLNGHLHSLSGKVKQALLYAATHGGPLVNSVIQYGGFLRSSDDLQFPNQQLYLNPATYSIARRKNGLVIQPDPFNGYTLSFQPTRPKSREWVKVSSADISDGPAISLGALTAETDLHGVVAGARLVGRLAASKTLQKITEAPSPIAPHK